MGDQLINFLRNLPTVHRVVLGIAGVVFALAAAAFVQWVSEPGYSLLYSGLDDTTLSQTVDALEAQDVTYRIEGGGSRILVPTSSVYQVRADLAASGIQGEVLPQGYELLDNQGLSVSNFRQQVDFQRALEGELTRTLLAMDSVTFASVHLVLPEEALFAENQEPPSASVLIDSSRELSVLEVETITFLVGSSVEGLQATDVTVAHVSGVVLQAAGDETDATAVTNRTLRLTSDFENLLASDVQEMLETVVGEGRSSVVVRAELNFDEHSTETEQYDPESSTPLREQQIDEKFNGSGELAAGTVGADGAPVETDPDEEYSYERAESTTEYGVDRTVTRMVEAQGGIDRLSVAVLIDDGSLTGATVPPVPEVQSLVAAAIGIDETRGDTIQVSAVAFPAEPIAEEPTEAAAASTDIMAMLPQIVGAVVLVIVAVVLMLMMRGGKSEVDPLVAASAPAAVPAPMGAGGLSAGMPAGIEQRQLVGATTGGPGGSARIEDLHGDVIELVQNQPEEIAGLLRSWLGDRRDR